MTNNKPNDVLLPCPFCASTDVKIVTADGVHFAQCHKCEATGPTGFKRGDEDDADWNSRAQAAPLQAEIERQSTVIDRQKNLIKSLRNELTESYAVGSSDRLKARCDEIEADNIKLAADRARLSAEIERLRPAYKSVLAQLDALSKPAGSDQ